MLCACPAHATVCQDSLAGREGRLPALEGRIKRRLADLLPETAGSMRVVQCIESANVQTQPSNAALSMPTRLSLCHAEPARPCSSEAHALGHRACHFWHGSTADRSASLPHSWQPATMPVQAPVTWALAMAHSECKESYAHCGEGSSELGGTEREGTRRARERHGCASVQGCGADQGGNDAIRPAAAGTASKQH